MKNYSLLEAMDIAASVLVHKLVQAYGRHPETDEYVMMIDKLVIYYRDILEEIAYAMKCTEYGKFKKNKGFYESHTKNKTSIVKDTFHNIKEYAEWYKFHGNQGEQS